jgi:hypothetical protein
MVGETTYDVKCDKCTPISFFSKTCPRADESFCRLPVARNVSSLLSQLMTPDCERSTLEMRSVELPGPCQFSLVRRVSSLSSELITPEREDAIPLDVEVLDFRVRVNSLWS